VVKNIHLLSRQVLIKYCEIILGLLFITIVTVWYSPGSQSQAGVHDNPQLALAEGDIYLQQDFNLIDHNGKVFNRARFNGNWSVLFFGYTNCPDICPNTMLILNQVQNRLKNIKRLNYVFVSVDPDRDTPKILKEYIDHFNPNFIGVSGEMAQIKVMTSQLDIKHRIERRKDSTDYSVTHSASITMIDPKGRWRAVMFSPHKPEKLAQTIQEVMGHFGEK
jgi:protein SCO1/2